MGTICMNSRSGCPHRQGAIKGQSIQANFGVITLGPGSWNSGAGFDTGNVDLGNFDSSGVGSGANGHCSVISCGHCDIGCRPICHCCPCDIGSRSICHCCPCDISSCSVAGGIGPSAIVPGGVDSRIDAEI